MIATSVSSKTIDSSSTSASTYMGGKGYTIYKECLDLKERRTIKDELTVRPYIPKSPIQPPAFPIFRESAVKLYLPRYYGMKNYGDPDQIRLPPGEDINLTFAGDLRDYQLNIVDIYLKAAGITSVAGTTSASVAGTTSAAGASVAGTQSTKDVGGGGLLEIPCGRGKTVIALKIIAALKKKTLVVVHKGFLLNQWIERISQFLPQARVGRIQGQILDIENKDIVIGMLQSLSMKEYPDTLFSSFGLTIVDECHHISSEVFSRSLQKIITKYTLGLSATMQRKDGLTKVFKMFLGEIVYSEERDTTDKVLVKAVQFVSDNTDFNLMCYDYRGNPAYSTMISKLCAFSPRSEFILQVLINELRIMPAQQVMILAHNKNLLTYLHDAIAHRQIATVGYYVGGMKEPDLKKSETCQVIIATYAMASEALDIKTLTTLILATPKTDIVQAVGRILRVKHERPMVIDIIDSHDVFLSQWQKRRKYYAENSYTIMHTKSDLYAANKWTTFAANGTGKNKKKKAPTQPLLCKGKDALAAAAAKFINTVQKEKGDSDNDDDDAYDEDDDATPFKQGKCLILPM
jgi:superfamily II DNA or RNA helicase